MGDGLVEQAVEGAQAPRERRDGQIVKFGGHLSQFPLRTLSFF
jgi:hypothetical protein